MHRGVASKISCSWFHKKLWDSPHCCYQEKWIVPVTTENDQNDHENNFVTQKSDNLLKRGRLSTVAFEMWVDVWLAGWLVWWDVMAGLNRWLAVGDEMLQLLSCFAPSSLFHQWWSSVLPVCGNNSTYLIGSKCPISLICQRWCWRDVKWWELGLVRFPNLLAIGVRQGSCLYRYWVMFLDEDWCTRCLLLVSISWSCLILHLITCTPLMVHLRLHYLLYFGLFPQMVLISLSGPMVYSSPAKLVQWSSWSSPVQLVQSSPPGPVVLVAQLVKWSSSAVVQLNQWSSGLVQ